MNSYEKLKETLKLIGCNFISTQTLIGYSVIVQSISKEMYYEFDTEGNFLRII